MHENCTGKGFFRKKKTGSGPFGKCGNSNTGITTTLKKKKNSGVLELELEF